MNGSTHRPTGHNTRDRTMIESNTVHVNAVLDDFEQGCIGGEGDYDTCFAMSIRGNDKDAYVADFARSLGFDAKWVEVDVCDEPGRVECARMENRDGNEPTEHETEEWKAGRLKLWYVVYTTYAEQVNRQAAVFN